MMASKRQIILKKKVRTSSKKQCEIKKKPLTPPSSESSEAESDSLSQTNPPSQENPDSTQTQTQTKILAEENLSGGEIQNEEVEENFGSIVADEDNGPSDLGLQTDAPKASVHTAEEVVLRSIHAYALEMENALNGGLTEFKNSPKLKVSWELPPDFVNLNVDPSIKGNDSYAFGGLIEIIMGHWLLISWENMDLARYCLQTIDLINADLDENHPLRKMIWDCKVLLHDPWECHISHVERQASKCADALATEALNLYLGLQSAAA
ncbi:hypothetical protein LguiB_017846 [Lonicera macranthoides]